MPTPYGIRGGMAFGTQELRVVRRALALALQPGPAPAQDVQDCLDLAGSLDEAVREGARLRAFLVADLARYRAALPGSVTGYLALLEEVLAEGLRPDRDDLAALGALRGNPRAAALLDRCTDRHTDRRGDRHTDRRPAEAQPPTGTRVPASRSHLHAVHAVQDTPAADTAPDPKPDPRTKPADRPAPAPGTPRPGRPVPTPGEVFPRRRPAPAPPQQLTAV